LEGDKGGHRAQGARRKGERLESWEAGKIEGGKSGRKAQGAGRRAQGAGRMKEG